MRVVSIEEITKRLSKLKLQGYVRSLRKGPTGVGHTLEKHLKLKENNISIPDFGQIELKAQREGKEG